MKDTMTKTLTGWTLKSSTLIRHFSHLATLVLFCLCHPQKQEYSPINDAVQIEKITDGWDVQAIYSDQTFYILKDFRAIFQKYQKDTEVKNLKIAEINYFPNGYSLPKDIPAGMIEHDQTLYFLYKVPAQIKKYIPEEETLSNPILLPLSRNLRMGSFCRHSTDKIMFTATDLENKNILKIFEFDLRNEKLNLVLEDSLKSDATKSLIRSYQNQIHLLNPYEKSYLILDQKGKLLQNMELKGIEALGIVHKTKPKLADPMLYLGLSGSEKLALRNNEVLDFYFEDNQIFLIARNYFLADKNSLSSISILCKTSIENPDVFHLIESKLEKKIIQFDQKGNLFYLEKDKDENTILNICPVHHFPC